LFDEEKWAKNAVEETGEANEHGSREGETAVFGIPSQGAFHEATPQAPSVGSFVASCVGLETRYNDHTMMRTVYVETSIPSFYHEMRSEPEMVARKEWTREWWALAQRRYELVTSPAVVDELERGEYASRKKCLELIEHLPLLAIEPAIMDIVGTYIARHVMPADPAGDALHFFIWLWLPSTGATSWSPGIASILPMPTNSATSGA